MTAYFEAGRVHARDAHDGALPACPFDVEANVLEWERGVVEWVNANLWTDSADDQSFQRGMHAHENGEAKASCPYPADSENNERRRWWLDGWRYSATRFALAAHRNKAGRWCAWLGGFADDGDGDCKTEREREEYENGKTDRELVDAIEGEPEVLADPDAWEDDPRVKEAARFGFIIFKRDGGHFDWKVTVAEVVGTKRADGDDDEAWEESPELHNTAEEALDNLHGSYWWEGRHEMATALRKHMRDVHGVCVRLYDGSDWDFIWYENGDDHRSDYRTCDDYWSTCSKAIDAAADWLKEERGVDVRAELAAKRDDAPGTTLRGAPPMAAPAAEDPAWLGTLNEKAGGTDDVLAALNAKLGR